MSDNANCDSQRQSLWPYMRGTGAICVFVAFRGSITHRCHEEIAVAVHIVFTAHPTMRKVQEENFGNECRHCLNSYIASLPSPIN